MADIYLCENHLYLTGNFDGDPQLETLELTADNALYVTDRAPAVADGGLPVEMVMTYAAFIAQMAAR